MNSGWIDGSLVGIEEGFVEGFPLGSCVGLPLGSEVGIEVVGTELGWIEGSLVCEEEGFLEGFTLGLNVGLTLGPNVGNRVGNFVGWTIVWWNKILLTFELNGFMFVSREVLVRGPKPGAFDVSLCALEEYREVVIVRGVVFSAKLLESVGIFEGRDVERLPFIRKLCMIHCLIVAAPKAWRKLVNR